jgi:hypothetical protein
MNILHVFDLGSSPGTDAILSYIKRVAQLAEYRSEKPGVVGASPTLSAGAYESDATDLK